MIQKTRPDAGGPRPRPRRAHERTPPPTRANRTSRNVVLLGAGATLVSTGAATIFSDALLGLAEVGVGLACFLVYELTD